MCFIVWLLSLSAHAADREVQRILLELLNQMDGFDRNENVKVKRKLEFIDPEQYH